MNILFTCAGRRNYLINYFKEALNGDGLVIASDMQVSAPALIDADIAVKVPAIYDENYIPTLFNIVKANNVQAIISLNDLELPLLSVVKEQFEDLGVKVIVSDQEVINISFDKWETVKFLEKHKILSPKTYINLLDAINAIKSGQLKFPLVVKPRWGSASIGIEFPETLEELELIYRLLTIKLKKTILAEVSSQDLDHAILIQEMIKGEEYGMDVLNDFNGKYFGTFVRQKILMRAGETDKAISVIDHEFEKLGRTIGENLNHIGNLDCDVFKYQNKLYVLELNPRFGGGYPFSHEAGHNAAKIFVEWLKGNSVVHQFSNYKNGIMFSKCDRLIKVN
jgi:carbamoyl-phosphate synthase large subunit